MIKYKNLYPKEFNNLQSASLANSLAELFGVEEIGNGTVNGFIDLANCAKRVDKALIYIPLSVAEWVLSSESAMRKKLLEISPLEEHCVSNSSRKRTNALLGMLSGKNLTSKDFANRELSASCIFDVLKRTKKKSLIISSLPNSFNDLFKSKSVDLTRVKSGAEGINSAIKAIKENIYDLIFLIDSDYDDCLRIGLPLSKGAKSALENQVSRYYLLNDATDVYWVGDVLVGFCPDKGCRRGFFASRFGSLSPADTNVVHFYGVKNQ